MAKIAALAVPIHRFDELESLASRMEATLALPAGEGSVQRALYRGTAGACCLLHTTPDVFSPHPQPATARGLSGVTCGYYLSASSPREDGNSSASPDSAAALVRDLAEHGSDVLRRSDGVLAFACWDREREELVAGVDKLGMRPLYRIDLPGGGLAVASEIKVLVPFAREPLVNWAAWEEQLRFGYQFGDHTLINGITRCAPAEVVRCRAGAVRSERYETFLEDIEVTHASVETFLEQNQAAFDGAMRRCRDAVGEDVGTMLTLSGGHDSRRILGWLLREGVDLEAYTVPLVRSDGTEYESGIVRELCHRAGIPAFRVRAPTREQHLRMRALRDFATDWESDEHIFATILAQALYRPDSVNYDGLLGDLLMHDRFLNPAYFQPGGEELFWARITADHSRWIRIPPVDPPLDVRLREQMRSFGDNPNRFTWFGFLSRTRRELALAPLMIQANAFESLCPFVDREVVRSALTLAPEQRAGAELQWDLIRRENPALPEVLTTHDAHAETDPRYLVPQPQWWDRERRARLRGPLPAASRAGTWRIRPKHRFKSSIERRLAKFLPMPRVSWELSKEEVVRRIESHCRATASGEEYVREVRALRDLAGEHPEWITPF